MQKNIGSDSYRSTHAPPKFVGSAFTHQRSQVGQKHVHSRPPPITISLEIAARILRLHPLRQNESFPHKDHKNRGFHVTNGL